MYSKIAIFLIIFFVPLVFSSTAVAVQPPTANAGPDLYVSSGQSIVLQGYGYDPNGYSLTYSWACNGGSLSSQNIAQPTYTAPYVGSYNNQTTYTCMLAVSNSYGGSSSDSMTVYINYSNNYNTSNSVQTNSATNISNYQAVLNAYFYNNGSYYSNYAYFQWGTTTGYGNQTSQQYLDASGPFSQSISGLNSNTTYHFRAVVQGNTGVVYGQDMTFYTSSSGSNYYGGSGSLLVSKKVVNLTSGNLNWSTSVNANPNDILSFAITMQAYGQDAYNVMVRDILPSNLIYRGNVTLNAGSNYSGDIISGINIGTIYAGQVAVVAYQVQVAGAGSFNYGVNTLSNSATVTSQNTGSQNANATVIVNSSSVYGATTISTGLTNDLLQDSFFIPLLAAFLGLWLYFSGRIYKLADVIKAKIKR